MDLPSSLDTVLKNHLIMKEIGRRLSCQDLGNCRIASKTVYDAITPFYRETAVVRNVDDFLKRLEEGETDLEEIPFRQFHFSGTDAIVWKDDRVAQFWNKCASVMTYLKLDRMSLKNRHSIKIGKKTYKIATKLTTLIMDKVDVKCQNLLLVLLFTDGVVNGENLKNLTIENTSDFTGFTNAELIKLVLRYPMIESLSLQNVFGPFNNSEFATKFKNILAALYEVRKKDFKSFNLKTLDILMGDPSDVNEIHDETSKILGKLKFPLERLSIDLGTSPSVNEVTSFLSNYNGTLKKLELFSGSGFTGPIDEFNFKVGFDSLKVLRISAFNSLGYLQFMPNLEFLHIYSTMVKGRFEVGGFSSQKNLRRTMKSMSSGTENLKLTSLREFRYDFLIEPEQISNLAKWMPNLKSLTLANLNNGKELFDMDLFSGFAGLAKLIFLEETGRFVFFKNVQKMKNLDQLAVLPILIARTNNGDYPSFDIEIDPGSDDNYDFLADSYDSDDD